jgi:two-component system, NtrC family, sensor kinase
LIELSIDEFIRLFKLASLGKLFHGLLHNINGPMQNICLDVEMMNHAIKKLSKLDSVDIKNAASRIDRIGDEFERINVLLKSTSLKAEQDGEYNNRFINLNDYLSQELSFLNANLYFKHNVEKIEDYQDNPLSIHDLSNLFLLSLSWLLQIVVEEIEDNELKKLHLKTFSNDSEFVISLSTPGGILPEGMIRLLNREFNDASIENTDGDNLELMLISSILKQEGTRIKSETGNSSSKIEISVPLI